MRTTTRLTARGRALLILVLAVVIAVLGALPAWDGLPWGVHPAHAASVTSVCLEGKPSPDSRLGTAVRCWAFQTPTLVRPRPFPRHYSEDTPGWNCYLDGNHHCGTAGAIYVGSQCVAYVWEPQTIMCRSGLVFDTETGERFNLYR